MPYKEVIGILTDVGTEELAHLEMVASILYQLTRNLSSEEIENSPMMQYFVDHTTGVYPASSAGIPTDMKYIGVKGDVIADLNEDLAADAAIMQEQYLAK
jgi:spore coat protein JC